MKTRPSVMIAAAALIFAALYLNPAAASDYSRNDMTQDQQKADKAVERYHITEALGPLAPVAMSPFFGLACLSGASILCDAGVLPDNEFLQGNEVLNNWLVFLLFTGLTIVTSVPKLVSVSKIFAEAADRIETYAGIISYAVVLLAAQQVQQEQAVTVFYSAGIISVTNNGLLAIAAAVNIFVIATVRLFFELLVLISPIPTLDAIFEMANKAVAGVLMTIYAFSPKLAFALNVIIFLFCLVIFRWVNRRLRYYKAILLEPIWAGFVRKFLGRDGWDPDTRIKRGLSGQFPGISMAVKCFPSRRLGKIKKKDRCRLVFADDGVSLVRVRLFKPPLVKKLDPAQLNPDVQEGVTVWWLELTENGNVCELLFGGVYTDKRDRIQSRLAAVKSTAQKPDEPGDRTQPQDTSPHSE